MEEMNAEMINPFLKAAMSVIKDVAGLELEVQKPYVKTGEFSESSILIMLGITGEVRGQVIIALPVEKACQIASKMMMGMPVNELDEISISAISELGNMIMGNAATILSTQGIGVDITPPTIAHGNMSIVVPYAKNICIPFHIANQMTLELDIAIKGGEKD